MYFLHADKNQSFLQVNIIDFDGLYQTCPKYPSKISISFQYLKKEVRNETDFYMQVDIKVFHKLILPFMTGVARHAQVPKITSLQYFRKNMLDYLDIWYEHRPPSHTQSIQNNKFTISQDGMLNKLS